MLKVLKLLGSSYITWVLLIILSVFSWLTYQSLPGDSFYHVKKTWYNTQSALAPTLQDKSAIRFQIAQSLLNTFKQIQTKNPADPKLIDVAKELVGQEQAGIYYLDLAKKNDSNIKDQVKILCDMLAAQQIAMYQVYNSTSPQLQPQLHDILAQTAIYLSQGMNW